MSSTPETLDISEVVERSGLPVSTLHVWEKHGLITPSGRDGLRRQYGVEVMQRIATVVLFKRGGYSLAEIAELLQPGAFEAGSDHLTRKLEQLRRREQELAEAISGIEHAISCPHASPMACPEFALMIDEVLPVRYSE